MKPKIEKTLFGLINIDGDKYTNDVLIRLNGQVEERNKKLSKEVFGTSHIISSTEAEYIYEEGAEQLLIGTGHFGRCELSEEAETFFIDKGCKVTLQKSVKAVKAWNDQDGIVIGLFHITC